MKDVQCTTLLELVQAVQESAETDAEVVAVVVDLLRSGRVFLIGNFAAASPDELEIEEGESARVA